MFISLDRLGYTAVTHMPPCLSGCRKPSLIDRLMIFRDVYVLIPKTCGICHYGTREFADWSDLTLNMGDYPGLSE